MKKIDEPENVVYGLYCECPTCGLENKIRYVGKTVNRPSVRLRGHIHKSRSGDKRPVSNWIRKHGATNIRYFILEAVPSSGDLYEIEQRWILKLGTTQAPGLNLTDGGPGSTGLVFSDQRKANIALSRKGSKVNPESLRELRDSLVNNRKLTFDSLLKVKERLWDGEPVSTIASEFNVSPNVIYRISNGDSAVDVPWPDNRDRVKHPKGYYQSLAASRRKEEGLETDTRNLKNASFKRSKMKIRDIRRIRDLRKSTSLTYSEIAEIMPEYVSAAVVGKVARGERWEWVG